MFLKITRIFIAVVAVAAIASTILFHFQRKTTKLFIVVRHFN